MTSLALVLLLAAAKPQVELKASPPFAVLGLPPRASATILFRLSVKDGGKEDYYCPRVEWEWEDGTHSEEESDCPAFAEATPADHEKRWSKSHVFWEAGSQVVKVRLYKADRLIQTIETKVEISGESVPGRYREP